MVAKRNQTGKGSDEQEFIVHDMAKSVHMLMSTLLGVGSVLHLEESA